MDSVPKVRARFETSYKPAGNTEKANPAKTKSAVNHRMQSADRYLSHRHRRPTGTRHSPLVGKLQTLRRRELAPTNRYEAAKSKNNDRLSATSFGEFRGRLAQLRFHSK